ncbi:methyltransferase domain-containing protein [Arsenicicoccus sp. MKL-02]|uniref:Methyltransferase domain-containing protein n=1 Tax=Arsenicicoccus cauae TaxID=2663847 RepID=A0A6I3ID97_9MICO|nr:class I SAM-dependent methyltransferase [Arsenicicoccus cauae]MTB70623.1 methyltransferase domain-containing protein [Arsenicicoccus cauae]
MRTTSGRPEPARSRLPDWCADLLDRPDALHRVAGRVWSTTPGLSARSAPRDRGAEGYDALAASRGYLRTAWGLDPVDQRSFARAALASRRGPMVDVACGGLALTADLYARAARPLLLVDRSLAVLLRAEERLARRGEVVLVQAELDALPLRPRSVDTVACLGVLHLVPDADRLGERLASWVRPGGTLHASSLTRGRRGSDALLEALHRAGELARPRTPEEVVRSLPLPRPRVVQRGAMTYVDGVVA